MDIPVCRCDFLVFGADCGRLGRGSHVRNIQVLWTAVGKKKYRIVFALALAVIV